MRTWWNEELFKVGFCLGGDPGREIWVRLRRLQNTAAAGDRAKRVAPRTRKVILDVCFMFPPLRDVWESPLGCLFPLRSQCLFSTCSLVWAFFQFHSDWRRSRVQRVAVRCLCWGQRLTRTHSRCSHLDQTQCFGGKSQYKHWVHCPHSELDLTSQLRACCTNLKVLVIIWKWLQVSTFRRWAHAVRRTTIRDTCGGSDIRCVIVLKVNKPRLHFSKLWTCAFLTMFLTFIQFRCSKQHKAEIPWREDLKHSERSWF